ncbi:MAG: hypothetical protein NC930_00955 [Candidatus Omnitrophica bacterium]|nr:hypothetical protein [Candidatus Omnitrophota bacterium]
MFYDIIRPIMRIEKPKESRPVSRFLLVVLLVIVILALYGYYQGKLVQPALPFQVQNFIGKVQIYSEVEKAWRQANRGQKVEPHETISTGPGSEIDLFSPNQILRVRIKENSLVELAGTKFLASQPLYRLNLMKGQLLGSTAQELEGGQVEVSVPHLTVETSNGSFLADAGRDNQNGWIGILRGHARVKSILPWKSTVIRELQKVGMEKGLVVTGPVPVSRTDWDRMKESYELIQKSALVEAMQMDLSKEAGNLFDYVFDHGTFYTSEFGYCIRDFVKDPVTDKVYLRTEYDVFPTGSYVGVYFKTRDLDVSKFQALKIDVRRTPDAGYPQSAKIELKSKSGIVRTFAIKMFRPKWETVQFPLRFRESTMIHEFTLVFFNNRVGEYKKGTVEFRNFTLVPKDTPQTTDRAVQEV